MELKLIQATLDTYEPAEEVTLTQEASEETIVPDYCPDIERIVSAQGHVFLHSRDAAKGEVEGSVRVCVLYTAEGEDAIRKLELSIPFSAQGEGETAECAYLSAQTELEALESRLLNPRKLSTRCTLVTHMTGYRKTCLPLSSDVEAEDGLCVEKKTSEKSVTLLRQIADKDLVFSDVLTLSPAREGAEELLDSRVSAEVNETKTLGNKLLFRGLFRVSLLYRTGSGALAAASAELPFSQVIEVGEIGENAQVTVETDVTGVDIQLDRAEDEGRTIPVTIYYHVLALLREKEELTFLTDLYSTAYPTNYRAIPLTVDARCERIERRRTVREVLETEAEAESVLSASAECGCVRVRGDELCTSVRVRALYRDADGSCRCARRRIEVTCPTEGAEGAILRARADCPEEVQWTINEQGIEVRFAVDFTACCCTRERTACIEEATLDVNAPRGAAVPSLVLRRFAAGDTLWETAKRYGTTVEAILAANRIEGEDEIEEETLLLVPAIR
ncbi:MAG: DUF3794 domain-containing protein [Oscillibacter sp.]|nr:DUF3794 domain-containing protein [Oscillibacter sp.]